MNFNFLERFLQSQYPSNFVTFLPLAFIHIGTVRNEYASVSVSALQLVSHNGHPLPWNDWASFFFNARKRSHRSGFRQVFKSKEKAVTISHHDQDFNRENRETSCFLLHSRLQQYGNSASYQVLGTLMLLAV